MQLIPDGDIAGVIWTTDPNETGIDIYLGIGGAPEGVLAAAALRCIGGQMQGRLVIANDQHRARARAAGIGDDEAALDLPADAAQRRGGQHAFGRAAGAHIDVDAGLVGSVAG